MLTFFFANYIIEHFEEIPIQKFAFSFKISCSFAIFYYLPNRDEIRSAHLALISSRHNTKTVTPTLCKCYRLFSVLFPYMLLAL